MLHLEGLVNAKYEHNNQILCVDEESPQAQVLYIRGPIVGGGQSRRERHFISCARKHYNLWRDSNTRRCVLEEEGEAS